MNKPFDRDGRLKVAVFSTVKPMQIEAFTLRGSETKEEDGEMGNIGQYFRQKQASTNALEGEQIR
jgi:hypothetical protein